MVYTYWAIYVHPKTGTQVTVHSLNPLPKHKTFRSAGGNRKFRRTKYTRTKRKVIIVAKSARNKKKGRDAVVDEELDELEELEDLEDLEDEELDDEEPDDEEDEDEDEDEEEEDEDDLSSLSVKELRAKARELGIKTSGMNKDALVEAIESAPDEDDEEEEDEEDEEDDDEEEEEAPPKKGKGKAKSTPSKTKGKKGKSAQSRSRTTDGMVGTQEIADAAGIAPRKLRILLRKLDYVEPDEETGRYEYSSLKHPTVQKILKAVKTGAADRAAKEGLDKLKDRKKANAGAKRSKSSGKKGSSSTAKKGKKKRTK